MDKIWQYVTKTDVKKTIAESGKWDGVIRPKTPHVRKMRINQGWGERKEVSITSIEQLEEEMKTYAYWTRGGKIAYDIEFCQLV